MWMVRAGRGGRLAREFLERGVVGIGWERIGDPTTARAKPSMLERFQRAYPESTAQVRGVWASQVLRFMNEIAVGDEVLTYDPDRRMYEIGRIASEPTYDPDPAVEELSLWRKTDWTGSAARDALPDPVLAPIGSIATLFKVREDAREAILVAANGPPIPVRPTLPSPAPEPEAALDPYADVAEEARERIKDRIARLGWSDMQQIVAALLRALGYRTTVSPAGADRGKDIFASPDGFGFEQPRTVVEVKHRPGQTMGAPEVRGFLGGRHKDDRGLYVSTGGFTREAYYEAERAPIPLTLMTLDDLARALIDSYEKLDGEGKRLLPLTRVYWPL